MSDRINVICKGSMEVMLKKTDPKPNLLVAELLDTELIGEGCIFTYRDAIKRLTAPNALFVPSRGRVWIQLVQSDKLFSYHQFRKYFKINEQAKIEMPLRVQNCFGSHILHDIQLNSLQLDQDFQILSDPIIVFEFNFNQLHSLKCEDHHRVSLKLKQAFDKPMMLFSWWDIDMDDDGDIKLSCAPYWARDEKTSHKMVWRDHWIQTIYYLPAFAFDYERQVDGFNHDDINAKRTLIIDSYHDSFSFWFDFPNQDEVIENSSITLKEGWSCTCGLHSNLSRNRLVWLNEIDRYKIYWKVLDKIIKANNLDCAYIYYFGEESLLPVIFGHHSQVNHIKIFVSNQKSYQFFQTIVEYNHLLNKMTIVCLQDQHKPITYFLEKSTDSIIVTDFHFHDFGVPLPILKFHKHPVIVNSSHISDSPISMPNYIVFKALLVKFEHLWKSYAPVKKIKFSGKELDMSAYDEMILHARHTVDWCFERRYLCEYQSFSLMENSIDLIKINILNTHDEPDNITKQVEIDLKHLKGHFDQIRMESLAIVVWVDQYLTDEDIISNGFQLGYELSMETEIPWTRNDSQLVSFLFPRHLTEKQWEILVKSQDPKINLQFNLSLSKCTMELKCNN